MKLAFFGFKHFYAKIYIYILLKYMVNIYVYISYIYNLHLYYGCCNMPSLYRRALVETRCLLQLFRLIERLLYIYIILFAWYMSNTFFLIERIFVFLVSRYISQICYCRSFLYGAMCFYTRYYHRVLEMPCITHSTFFSLSRIKILNFTACTSA